MQRQRSDDQQMLQENGVDQGPDTTQIDHCEIYEWNLGDGLFRIINIISVLCQNPNMKTQCWI